MSPSQNSNQGRRHGNFLNYDFGGTFAEVIHSLMGRKFPHSGQEVAAY